jgi:hypothetical protein
VKLILILPCRHGASALGTQNPGSNPARNKVIKEIVAMLLFIMDVCVCVFLKKRRNGIGPRIILKILKMNFKFSFTK